LIPLGKLGLNPRGKKATQKNIKIEYTLSVKVKRFYSCCLPIDIEVELKK
jgi:hypothetical protein